MAPGTTLEDDFEDGNLDGYEELKFLSGGSGRPDVRGYRITSSPSIGSYAVSHKTEQRILYPEEGVPIRPPAQVKIDVRFTFLSGVTLHLWDRENQRSYNAGVRSNYNGQVFHIRKSYDPFRQDPNQTTSSVKQQKTTKGGFGNNEWFEVVLDWERDGTLMVFIPSTGDRLSIQDEEIEEATTFAIQGYHYDGTGYFDNVRVSGIPGPARVSAKATTLTLLPGYNERSEDPDGDELNSSIPDLSILDAAFIADDRLDLPETLDDAIDATRGPFPEYPGEEFKAYRLMNQIELAFETEDGKTISDWSTAEIRINEEEDPTSPDGEWKPSYILVEGESDHGEDNPVRRLIERPDYDWFDGNDRLPGDDRQWYDEPLEIDVNEVLVDGVEGVRASFIRGARDTFVLKMRQRVLELDFWQQQEFFDEFGIDLLAQQGIFQGPPYFYTFIDLVLMADGSRYARVWDASPYPRHYLYVDNDQVDMNEFEEGEEWNRNELPMLNRRFMATFNESNDNRTPFTPHVGRGYERAYDRPDPLLPLPGYTLPGAYGPHPVMEHIDPGDVLSKTDLVEHDAFAEPHFPW